MAAPEAPRIDIALVLRDSFRLCCRHPVAMLAATMILFSVPLGLAGWLAAAERRSGDEMVLFLWLATLWTHIVVLPIAIGMWTRILFAEEAPGPGLHRVPGVLATGVAVLGISLLGLPLAVIGFFYVYGMLAPAIAIIAREGGSLGTALRRSLDLTRGQRSRVFAVVIFLEIAELAAEQGAAWLVGTGGSIALMTATLVPLLLVTPLKAASIAVITHAITTRRADARTAKLEAIFA